MTADLRPDMRLSAGEPAPGGPRGPRPAADGCVATAVPASPVDRPAVAELEITPGDEHHPTALERMMLQNETPATAFSAVAQSPTRTRRTLRARPVDRLPEALRPLPGRIRTIAHRGDSSSAPENTIEAFEAAVAAGSDLIELDLRLTADGDAAVIHDESALRTTGIDAPVSAISAATLGAADAGSWFGPGFAGARVPMFREVAQWGAVHPDVGWLVEFKGRWTAAQLAGPVAAIRRHGLAGRVVLQSFEVESVAAARDVAPDLPRALLVYRLADTDGLLERLRVLEATGCNPSGQLPNEVPGLAARLREDGYSVYPWTLDEPDEWGAAGGAGVDGVITNRPGAFRSWHALRWRPTDASALAS